MTMTHSDVSVATSERAGAMAPGRWAAARHAGRLAGQTGALAAMIRAGRPFDEVAQQVLAARGSLDALLLRLLTIELDGCVPVDQRGEVAGLVNVALGRRGVTRPAPADSIRAAPVSATRRTASTAPPARS